MSINWNANRHYANSIFDTIGRTPLVRLNRVVGSGAEILVKVEYFSPSGSLKDRIYYNMFTRAEERGELRPGMTILECSTGNAGIACSFVAAVKGYKCIIVMPEGMSEERKNMDVAYGTEMVYTPGGESDVDLALEKLAEIRSKDPGKYWVPSQFDNPDNIEAHYQTTGPEIWEQTSGKLDAYVATQGTGGQLTGIGRYVREQRVIELEDAVRKMSSAVATRVGLRDRGLLRPGYYADVVVFDPSEIHDLATFADPHRLSRGVSEVWINGVRVLKQGRHTGATPGKVLMGAAAR